MKPIIMTLSSLRITMFMFLLSAVPFFSSAQFSFGGQLVQRGELRHGYGKLITQDAEPAAFISQRLRLEGQYTWEKIKLFASIQDIRTWGNTSQVKLTDNFLSVHEAWIQIPFNEFWSVQLGRQEISYDNVRFLGNLDWVLQARAHDFARIKYERNRLKIHAGAGFNQQAETLSGNTYTLTDQYKLAQLLRLEQHHKQTGYSILMWNNGRQLITLDSNSQVVEKDIRYILTMGLSSLYLKKGNTTVSCYGYYQTGENIQARKVNAFNASGRITQLISLSEEKSRSIKGVLGYEVLSGTNSDDATGTDRSFEPMFATHHIHNGYMDYFYAGGRHIRSVGLKDAFAKITYHHGKRLWISGECHAFNAYEKVMREDGVLSADLGTELDVTTGWIINKATSVQAGYSHMFPAPALLSLQQVLNPADGQYWAYFMLIFRPDSEKKFIGVDF